MGTQFCLQQDIPHLIFMNYLQRLLLRLWKQKLLPQVFVLSIQEHLLIRFSIMGVVQMPALEPQNTELRLRLMAEEFIRSVCALAAL